MILNNAKYEAERRWQCEKRKRKKFERSARRSGIEEVVENIGEGGGYIGYADRRKGDELMK